MIFVSAIYLAEIDHLRGYEMGAVDARAVSAAPIISKEAAAA